MHDLVAIWPTGDGVREEEEWRSGSTKSWNNLWDALRRGYGLVAMIAYFLLDFNIYIIYYKIK